MRRSNCSLCVSRAIIIIICGSLFSVSCAAANAVRGKGLEPEHEAETTHGEHLVGAAKDEKKSLSERLRETKRKLRQAALPVEPEHIPLPPLVLAPNRTAFKVLQLADLHFGEDPNGTWGPDQDRSSLAVIEAVLDADRPDLVVFSGDQITGENLMTAAARQHYLSIMLEPLRKRGIPWATIFGNHDSCDVPGCLGIKVALPHGDGTTVQDFSLAQSGGTGGLRRLRSFGGRRTLVPLENRTDNATANHTADNRTLVPSAAKIFDRLGSVGGRRTLVRSENRTDNAKANHTADNRRHEAARESSEGARESAARVGFISARDRQNWKTPEGRGDRRYEYLAHEIEQNLSHTGADGFFISSAGGLSNYRLKVFASPDDAEADRPSFILWFLDTGGGNFPEALHADQIEWLQTEAAELDAQYGALPGALYTHVPLRDYAHLDPNSPTCSGVSDDSVTPLGEDRNLVSVLSSLHIRWVFAGHNHGNDWCCKLNILGPAAQGGSSINEDKNTVNLCYGRHSGWGGYSTPNMHTRGARVLSFNPAVACRNLLGQDSAPGVETYVRLEDGSLVERSPYQAPDWGGYHWTSDPIAR